MQRLSALILGAVAALPVLAQTLERPAVKVGDECHIDVFDNLRKDARGGPEKIAERHSAVTAAGGDRIVINWTQKLLVTRDTEDIEAGEYVYDRDLNLLELNGRKYNPAYPIRFYPVTPAAEKKGAKSDFPRREGDGSTSAKMDVKASSWQSIEVPAGKFDVITLTWDGGNIHTFTMGRAAGRSASSSAYEEIALSPATWCAVKGLQKFSKAGGGIWFDRSYKLMSFKN